jgi:4-hydroxy-tetrahydrodipicolinate synthase
MARGADGPMAGFSFPEMLSGVYDLMKRGETEAAHCLFNTYLPLLRYEAQGEWGIAIRKEVMRQRGAMECAALRAPGPTLGAVDLAEIGDMIGRMNIGFQFNSRVRH